MRLVRMHVRGAADVQRLHINQCEGTRPVKARDDDIRPVPQAHTMDRHPLGDLPASAITLR